MPPSDGNCSTSGQGPKQINDWGYTMPYKTETLLRTSTDSDRCHLHVYVHDIGILLLLLLILCDTFIWNEYTKIMTSYCPQWVTYFWALFPRLPLSALCLLCLLIVILTGELLPDYHWFPADNWTVNEIWWTDGPSPWGQLPCPLWLSGVGAEVGPGTHLPRRTRISHISPRIILMVEVLCQNREQLGWRVFKVSGLRTRIKLIFNNLIALLESNNKVHTIYPLTAELKPH